MHILVLPQESTLVKNFTHAHLETEALWNGQIWVVHTFEYCCVLIASKTLWWCSQAPEKTALPPKPTVPASSGSSGASLQQGGASLRPHSPSVDARGKNEQGTTTLEELRAQLRELKGTVELMKSQHKYESGARD